MVDAVQGLGPFLVGGCGHSSGKLVADGQYDFLPSGDGTLTCRRTPRSDVPDKSTFESLYAGQAPWDIGRPQKPFIDVADQITGSVLDAGCGTGDTALFLAS